MIAFVDLIRKNLRKGDCFARLGGEEFGLYLPQTSEAQALAIAERLRRAVEELVVISNDQCIALSVSMGLAFAGGDEGTWEVLFNRADAALYEAKRSGRNQVTSFSSASASGSKPMERSLSRTG